jgi:hypothetical protein
MSGELLCITPEITFASKIPLDHCPTIMMLHARLELAQARFDIHKTPNGWRYPPSTYCLSAGPSLLTDVLLREDLARAYPTASYAKELAERKRLPEDQRLVHEAVCVLHAQADKQAEEMEKTLVAAQTLMKREVPVHIEDAVNNIVVPRPASRKTLAIKAENMRMENQQVKIDMFTKYVEEQLREAVQMGWTSCELITTPFRYESLSDEWLHMLACMVYRFRNEGFRVELRMSRYGMDRIDTFNVDWGTPKPRTKWTGWWEDLGLWWNFTPLFKYMRKNFKSIEPDTSRTT